jgi:hypothetical protein
MTNSLESGSLIWDAEKGYGRHTAPPMTYDGDYFAKYQDMDNTFIGLALTAVRVNMVNAYYHGDDNIDIGIGGGLFVFSLGCKGYDVSENAVQWLKIRQIYQNPYETHPESITCWDSLEHIPEPEALINRVKRFVFVSMPIYEDEAHCRASKHYKPGEHIHYWTHKGLIDWFARLGFILMESSQIESKLGREGINSYVFRRF